MSEPAPEAAVSGERGNAALKQPVSVQSRVSNFLALGLMSVLGLGMLTWYYAHALSRQSRAQQDAQSLSSKRASGDAPLPSLGRIELPPQPAAAASPLPPAPVPLPEVPLQESSVSAATSAPPPAKSAAELALDRELSGAVFSPQGSSSSNTASAAAPLVAAEGLTESTQPTAAGDLTSWLRPSTTAAVRAQMLPTQRLLLPKGAFLDCTLETAIDSTLPGMTTCVMATDTFGVDGKVVLLERGTKLVGETRGQVQQGAARVFVLWNEARTPTGVIVPLASPGADELGRSGLPGTVDRHFWERFGAAMLVSVIDGAVQAAVQSSRSGSNAVIVNPSATQDVMTEVLKGTIGIAPTVRKQQGDRIQVLVARDLDFRAVYELRSDAGR
jgi:type IV secretion system protein VirB10